MGSASIYQQLAESIGVTDSPTIPKVFELLADEKEAQFLLAASPPATRSRCTMIRFWPRSPPGAQTATLRADAW